MILCFKKTILSTGLLRLFALVAALAVARLSFVSISAAGQGDPPQLQITNERLEKIWVRQLRIYERLGRADEFVDRVQRMINRAEANGKDVSAVQAALDAFAAQVKEAHPIYESMKGIVNSHQGFDQDGKVTDPEKAKETVQGMREKLREIKSTMHGTRKALREAIQAFPEANPRPQPTANP